MDVSDVREMTREVSISVAESKKKNSQALLLASLSSAYEKYDKGTAPELLATLLERLQQFLEDDADMMQEIRGQSGHACVYLMSQAITIIILDSEVLHELILQGSVHKPELQCK
jgi:hypothetical protein